jgi:3-oxosteroid 1-dehydrogenase
MAPTGVSHTSERRQDVDVLMDLVVVGSGLAGLTGAVTAAARGLSVLVVESSTRWGGTSAISGGGLWIPDNSLTRAADGNRTPSIALDYINAAVGDVGPASSQARRLAFIDGGRAMVDVLDKLGLPLIPKPDYPDYHWDCPGARRGRLLEPPVFDMHRIGAWAQTMQSNDALPPIPIGAEDIRQIMLARRTLKGARTALKVGSIIAAGMVRRQQLVGVGRSLMGQLMLIAQRQSTPVWLDCPVQELIVEDGQVVRGVVVNRSGRQVRIGARAVLIAAGGFAHAEHRRKHQPSDGQWSGAAGGDCGVALDLAEQVGAAVSLMDSAWWMPVLVPPGGKPEICVWERSAPGSIIVDQSGQRFVNESGSYMDVGAAILERDASVPAVPCWLIMNPAHRRNYPFITAPGGYTPRRWFTDGFMIKASSLEELANRCSIDAAGLRATVERFNGFAKTGVDEDFDRGGNEYDNHYGDPRVRPNPNLAAIDRAPFYAAPLWPGDIGTNGGLLTDERARVLSDGSEVIDGLWAAGNSTASVMGRRYPGPGCTLSAAAVFGYIAAMDAAEKIRGAEVKETS